MSVQRGLPEIVIFTFTMLLLFKLKSFKDQKCFLRTTYFRVYLRSKCKTCYLVLIHTHALAQIQRPPVLMEEALSMSEKAVLNLEGKSNHSAHLCKLDQKKVIEINFLSLFTTAKDSTKFFLWESKRSRRQRMQIL